MKIHSYFLLLIILLYSCSVEESTKPTQSDILSPVITPDISNQQVNAFAEDAQGHIWIGTFRGLNKYNAHEYHQYFCTDDSLSLPDNQVQALLKDKKGKLWVSTINGLCMYTDEDSFKRIPFYSCSNRSGKQLLENKYGDIFLSNINELFKYNPQKNIMEKVLDNMDPNNYFITKCFIDSSDNLWVASPTILKCYNLSDMSLKDSITLENMPRYYTLLDNDELWLTGTQTIQIYNTNTHRFKDVPAAIKNNSLLSKSEITYIYPYNNTLLLNTTKDGMFCYNPTSQTLIHQDEDGFPFKVPRFTISQMFTDSQKNLWIGSTDQGYSVIYNYKERFNNNNFLQSFLQNKSVISISAGTDNSLWISTSQDGVYKYELGNKKIEKIDVSHIFSQTNSKPLYVNRILADKDNNIWMTSRSNEAVVCQYINNRLHLKKKYNVHLPMSLAQDNYNNIWIGCVGTQLYQINTQTLEMKTIQAFNTPASGLKLIFTTGLLPFKDKMLAAALNKPLTLVDVKNGNIEETKLPYEEFKRCIRRSVFIPTDLFTDAQGDIWIGTVGNGLLHYSPDKNTIESIPGTACTDISAIEQDAQGNLWISTLYGLSKFNNKTGEIINYYATDGIGGNQFYDRSSCKLSDGTIAFGGTHGITLFNPMDIHSKRKVPLLFEDLKVHNQLIHPGKNQCIQKHLSQNPIIRLSHNQNGFSITFSALDYSESGRVNYHYTLEGFDKYWIDSHHNQEAYYANLPAGTYTFKIKATNNDQSIAETENAITIIIEPAPWATWWAYLIYTTFILTIIALFANAWKRIRTEKMLARHAAVEMEQEQRINRMNMSFFTNISHEFRTPLTMIAGPVYQLCNSADITDENKNLLCIVQRSVNRMLRLVNQMMDFHKLENDTLKLKVKHTDIITLLKKQSDIFRINSEEKNISLNTYGLEDTLLVWLDADKMEKIFDNLLSNAMKFTPRGGYINITFDVITKEQAGKLFRLNPENKDSQYIKISVTNSGSYIPEDKLEKIFERYYQISNNQGTYNWGTGIGLYYVYNLVKLHHGYIKAENLKDEEGVKFTFILPTNDNSYTTEEKEHNLTNQTEVFPINAFDTAHVSQVSTEEDKNQKTILVVDDDTEIVHYLQTLLSPHYRIVCRFDVDSALKVIREEAPDLILSDIIMPEKDGYQLCRAIKEDLQLCHIPVILVTAKSTIENQVKGLETGADAYVTKPFDPNYLIALINSQLKNRNKVRNLLGKTTQTDNIEENILSPQDNAFMTELYRLMEKELSNPELDITHMTELMHISRTKFYYKVKGLTGENPSIFFKTYKLNRAAELILEGIYTISEIADMTGFSTLSHFSKSFKKQFGVSPSEYKTK